MLGSLSSGLQFAKGLASAWDRPLIGTHHMLGHLLIASLTKPGQTPPQYPFLSFLCSGGHTMLVLLKSLTEHEVIINTIDIAAGDSLDKCARELGLQGKMLGPELEKYVAGIDTADKAHFASIKTHTRDNEFGFHLTLPMRTPKHKKVPDTVEFAFASFLSSIEGFKQQKGPLDERTNRFVAYKTQELLFDHIVNRINIAFIKHGQNGDGKFRDVHDFVCSGGVAANSVLREKLQQLHELSFHFPDLEVCTDNATMIGVAGIEVFEKLRLKSPLGILPIRRWPMNELLDVEWDPVSSQEYHKVTGW